jgi:hypothetical protein
MDIISEILETDKLADEKIKKAHEKQAQLEQQTQSEIEKCRQDTKQRIESYRKKMQQRSKSESDGLIAKIDKEEKEKIARIDELYSNKHKKWEKAIYEKVVTSE